MKRITLILWLLLSTAIVTFAYDFQSGDLCYNITSDSTVEVTYQEWASSGNYAGLASAVIPESVTYNGTTYHVTSIGNGAFNGGYFAGCSGLTFVSIPSGVISIDSHAFAWCIDLKSVVWNAKNYPDFTDGRTPFYYYTFEGMAGGGFDLRSQITSFIFGDGVQHIPSYICNGMTNLTSITIPNSVTSIGDAAFSGCTGLMSIIVESGNGVYDSRNNCNAIIKTQNNTLIAGCQNSIIPNSVTTIGDYAFSGCSGLTSITIPNSVTSIGDYAFSGCSGLTSITIPNSVTSIGSSAFSDCSGLTSITIPNSVTSIGDYAFYGCSGLTSATIGNGVTSIGSSAFSDCSGLTSITIPNNVTSIGEEAFSGCSGLTSITIPSSVTSIGGGAFKNCYRLTSVVWNAKNCADFTYNDTPFYRQDSYYGSNGFDLRSQITSFTFGDSVWHIPACICNGMNNLTTVTIPNSVTSIGDEAFRDCIGLTSVAIPNSVTSIGWNAFEGCIGLTSATIGNSVTSIGDEAFRDCSSLTSVTIGNSVTSIGGKTFYGCRSLASVVWNVKNYSDFTSTNTPFYKHDFNYSGSGGFDLRSQITSFVLGDSVQYIPAYICQGMSNLTSVIIPRSVTGIGERAFNGCSGLTSITIPNSVTSIGEHVFEGCNNLASVVWNIKNYSDFTIENTPFYCSGNFDLRSQITSFVLGDSVQHIPAYICNGMNNLTTMTIPGSVTSIGSSAFGGCEGLTSVVWNAKQCDGWSEYSDGPFFNNCHITSFTFGEDVESIPYAICDNMCNLTTIVIPDKVTSIGVSAFYGCSSLTSITIGKSVTSIGNYAFKGCTGLESVVWNAERYLSASDGKNPFYNSANRGGYDLRSQITSFVFGNSVKSIPAYICNGMYNLTSIALPNSVTSIGDRAFSGCRGLTSVTIPNGVTNFGDNAFSYCSGLTSVTIPNSVTDIGERAFQDCYNLTSVTIGSRVTTIGKETFSGCRGLTSVTIPNGVTNFGDNAFSYCSGLTSVTIPNSVTDIGERAFQDCYNLTSVTIGSRVTTIGKETFSGCSSLASITIPNNITHVGTNAFWGTPWIENQPEGLIYIGKALYKYQGYMPQGTEIILKDNTTSISGYAFTDGYTEGYSGLISITIPNSVTDIGESAFYDCNNLASVTIPNGVTSIGEDAFYNVSNIMYSGAATGAPWGAKNMNGCIEGYLVYTDTTKTNLLTCFRYAQGNITIPNSVTKIKESAFAYCSDITSITIGNSVTSMGNGVFRKCWGLTSVVWNAKNCSDFTSTNTPFYKKGSDYYDSFDLRYQIKSFVFGDSVQHIPASLCSKMSNLDSVAIPNSVTNIGDSAFHSCHNISFVTIPKNVMNIGKGAFADCSNMKSIIVEQGNTNYDSRDNCNAIIETFTNTLVHGCRNSIIPDGVIGIGDDAFYGCWRLTSVSVPNSVTWIGNNAFNYCSGLSSITLSDNITSIGDGAFANCDGLTSVVWNINNYPDCKNEDTPFCGRYYDSDNGYKNFDLRSQITSFVFGDSVQHIPAYICSGMDKLASIHIGKDVMSIGNCALAGCTTLTSVMWNALDYTATNPFYCESVGNAIGFDLRPQITSFVCSDSVYAITPGICYQMTNLDTLACPIMALESENTNMENYPKALKYIKLLNGELTETIQSILSTGSKTIRTLDLGGVSNTEIADEAFREFYKMDTLVLPAQLTKIPYKAVSECVALQSIVVPEGVTEIEYGAFSGCSGLQTLSLPSTLQSIADNGFASCSALKEMRVHAQTPPTVYANTFSGVKRTIPVYVPQSAYNDYTTADVWKEFFIQSDVADDVENVPSHDTYNQGVRKVLRDGQIYILRGNKTYTLTGEEVK